MTEYAEIQHQRALTPMPRSRFDPPPTTTPSYAAAVTGIPRPSRPESPLYLPMRQLGQLPMQHPPLPQPFTPTPYISRRPPPPYFPSYRIGPLIPRPTTMRPAQETRPTLLSLTEYSYTNSYNQTKGIRDPDMDLITRHFPEMLTGVHIMDPYYPYHRCPPAHCYYLPTSHARAARAIDYIFNEVIRNAPSPQTRHLMRNIPALWLPKYYQHRRQRILAMDPFLCLMELFCLRFESYVETWLELRNQIQASFTTPSITYRSTNV
jgi:hypothetical protein